MPEALSSKAHFRDEDFTQGFCFSRTHAIYFNSHPFSLLNLPHWNGNIGFIIIININLTFLFLSRRWKISSDFTALFTILGNALLHAWRWWKSSAAITIWHICSSMIIPSITYKAQLTRPRTAQQNRLWFFFVVLWQRIFLALGHAAHYCPAAGTCKASLRNPSLNQL